MGVCHELGSYFQEKIPKRVCRFFTKIQGYNIWKKFQIGSVILMAQNTKQKKAQLIDYFDLVWTKKSTIFGKFFENGSHFFPKQPSKSYFGDLHKAQKFRKGSNFSSKILERVDIENL